MGTTDTATLSIASSSLQEFAPGGLGIYSSKLRTLARNLGDKTQLQMVQIIDRELSRVAQGTDVTALAYRVSLCVLRDAINAGYYPVTSNERLFIAPLWESNAFSEATKRTLLRRAFARERDQQEPSSTLAEDGSRPGNNADAVLRMFALEEFTPQLTLVKDDATRRLWRDVRSTWSMKPDKSAPGREVSFLLTDAMYTSTPVGIFQYRNVVPEIAARDEWLGISLLKDVEGLPRRGYLAAIERSGDARTAVTATLATLENLLSSVRSDGFSHLLEKRDARGIAEFASAARRSYLEARRTGLTGASDLLATAKRAETASELCRSVLAFHSALSEPLDIALSLQSDKHYEDIRVGLRKIWHYHMGFVAIELSICGAAPPFGPMRVGKLMASLAGSAEAVAAWGADRPLGQIARSTYHDLVRSRVPNPGPLIITTSGLYPGHSAQYNRVRVGNRAWVKYGETSGYGNFQISDSSISEMIAYNDAADGYRHITRIFGEGSGARFREVGRALSRLKLPDLRKHNMRRPLYALSMVADPAGAIFGWAGVETPRPPSASQIYDEWDRRWLQPRRDELVMRAQLAVSTSDPTVEA